MAYVNYGEVIARYPLIETWGKSETEVNSDLIYYAEVELNGRLGSHFSVPFSVAHPTIKDLTIDLCLYRILVTKDPDKAEKFKERIIGRIEDIKNGDEYIYTGSGTTIDASGSEQEVWSNTMGYVPTHSMLDPESTYTEIDPDAISDLEDERI